MALGRLGDCPIMEFAVSFFAENDFCLFGT